MTSCGNLKFGRVIISLVNVKGFLTCYRLKLLVLLSSYFSQSDLSKRRILQHSNGERGYNLYFGSFCFICNKEKTNRNALLLNIDRLATCVCRNHIQLKIGMDKKLQ